MKIIVGLGNPGEEYLNTRHNSGRIMLEAVRKNFDLPEWEFDKKYGGIVSLGKIGKEKVFLLCPDTFMNKSGESVKKIITSAKKAEDLVVVYDDLDLGLGTIKISYNRSAGGHKGLQSIIKSIKTEAFTRIRIGVSPMTPAGKIKRPHGDSGVIDFILAKFKKPELDLLKKISKKVAEAVEVISNEGREKAMGEFN